MSHLVFVHVLLLLYTYDVSAIVGRVLQMMTFDDGGEWEVNEMLTFADAMLTGEGGERGV